MNVDLIQLKLPSKKEYVKIARLTASGLASGLGFDLEEIEDIKAAVGEAVNIAFKFNLNQLKSIFMVFKVSECMLEIETTYPGEIQILDEHSEEDLSFVIIQSLMSEAKFLAEGTSSKLIMKKRVRATS